MLAGAKHVQNLDPPLALTLEFLIRFACFGSSMLPAIVPIHEKFTAQVGATRLCSIIILAFITIRRA